MSTSRRSCVAFFVFSLGVAYAAVPPLGAQGSDDAVVSAVREMESAAGSAVASRRSPLTGLATFLAVKRGAGIPVPDGGTPEARAIAFIDAHGRAFGLVDSTRVMPVRTIASDAVGMDHVRLRQVVRGVPVVGGEIMVHLRGSAVVAANGRTVPDADEVDTTPVLEAKQAGEVVRRVLEKDLQVTDATLGAPQLEILNKGLFDGARRPTRLTWFVEATGPALREFVWVDARTAAIVLHFSQLTDARDRVIYTAGNTGSLPGTLIATEGSPPMGDADGLATYNFSGDTYDYFLTEHGRDSYDGLGASLVSTVHYCPSPARCPYHSASWNGTQMVYGEGYSRADDIDAHELTHAVTEHSANLYSYMQSGALSESFSDIFGETVDQWNTPRGGVARRGTDTAAVKWLIGEDLPGVGAVRNMMSPGAFGDPGKMTDTRSYCKQSDRGGVHKNSGVPNHAYALMVDGGTYNGIAVTGIGLQKAAKVQYRALTQYLLSASDFRDDYDVLQQSCQDLVGTAGITGADCAQVRQALEAVEMAAPWPCVPTGVQVSTAGDTVSESDETFAVAQGNAAGATNIGGRSIGTIHDDEGVPTPPATSSWALAREGMLSMARAVFGASTYVAVGQDGDIWTSPTGVTWTKQASPTRASLSAVTYGGGQFVAVGGACCSSFGDAVVLTSPDGSVWKEQELGTTSGLRGVAYGGGLYVAVGGWGTILTSPDAVTWSAAISGATDDFTSVAYGAGAFVAVGTTMIVRSTDGSTWVQESSVLATLWDVTYTGTQFLAVGYWNVMASPDGTVWSGTEGSPPGGGTAVSGTPTMLVMNSWSDRRAIYTSPTGDLWTRHLLPDEGRYVTSITHGPSGFVALTALGAVVTSKDGGTWVTRRMAASRQLNGVAYGGGRFCAVGSDGAVAYSTDGATWTNANGLPPRHVSTSDVSYDNWQGIAYGANRFVAVGGDTTAVMTSPDCLNWTDRNPGGVPPAGADSAWYESVARGAGLFVAVGATYTRWEGDRPMIATSADGITWSQRGVGLPPGYSLVAVAYGDGRYVVVGFKVPEGTPIVVTSDDGLIWDQQPTPPFEPSTWFEPTSISGIGYSSRLFTAVGSQIWTSPDGVEWTLQKDKGDFYLGGIASGSSRLVATGWGVFESSDPAVWVPQTVPTQHYLGGVAYSPAKDRFVAVGDSAIIYTNDPLPKLSVADEAIGEGDAGSADLLFTVSLSRASGVTVTVNYATSNGTATAGSDYTATPGTLTFVPGETSKTIAVPVLGDTTYEGDETFTVKLSAPVNAGILDGTAQGTIQNDDPAPVLAIDDVTVTEGTGAVVNAVFKVTLTGATALPATVKFATADGTAVAPGDYTKIAGTLSFPLGTTARTITVVTAGDTLDESDETFSVNLSGSTNAMIGKGTGIGTIVDNDRAGSLQFSAVTYGVNEAGGTATIKVTRTGGGASGVTVDYATSDGTAKAGADYTARTGTLSFGAGVMSQSFTIPVTNDTVAEGAETVTVALSNPAGGAALGSPATAVLTINDNDIGGVLKFSAPTYTASEAGPAATITVTRSGGTAGAVTVDYATTDGTATAGSDYRAASGTLSFAAGALSRTFKVSITNDTLGEGPETVNLAFSSPTGGAYVGTPATAVLTITDNEPMVQFSAAAYTVSEATASATITVSRTAGTAAFTVDYATSNGTATEGGDYTARADKLSFAAGVMSKTFTVPILKDTLGEGPETVNLALSGATGGGAYIGPRGTAVLTITDDEPMVQFSAAAYTVSETGPAATITVTRTGGSAPFTVNYATSDGTATAGSDYTEKHGPLDFAAGVVSKTLTVPILEDTLVEGPESAASSRSALRPSP